MNTKSEFPTRDIYLATVLKVSGIPLIRTIDSNGKGIFVFQASQEIQKLISGYFNNQLRIDPKAFVETWRALKSLAFSTIGDMGKEL